MLQKQTQAANIDLLLSPLFCCGYVGISQQVCSFIFLLAHYSFYFSTSPPLKLISNLVCDGFCSIVLSPSLLVLNCAREKKMLLSRPVQQVTHECTHRFPPPLLSVSLPGSQIYHSAVCILVQFLMLRLMGRTVTTVLSSFIFQMVRCLGLSPSLSPRQAEDVFCPLLFFFLFCSDAGISV